MAYFNHERFEKWEEENSIPTKIMDMVTYVSEKVGYPLYEETLTLTNRWGDVIGYARGFKVIHCTSSYLDGPGVDYTPELIKWLCGLGFELGDSYGDNGMDSATNWHDTYWTKEIIYTKSKVYDDFIERTEEEEEAEREYYEDRVSGYYYDDFYEY